MKEKLIGAITRVSFNLGDDFKCNECNRMIKKGYIYSNLLMEKQDDIYKISSVTSQTRAGKIEIVVCHYCSLNMIKGVEENLKVIKKELNGWFKRNKVKLTMEAL